MNDRTLLAGKVYKGLPMRIKNNKLVLSCQANIIMDGKTVKWKTGGVENVNYVFTCTEAV